MSDVLDFWRGDFGDEYAKRSPGDVSANVAFFSRVLSRTENIRSVIELGAGTGANLMALQMLLSPLRRVGIEINRSAYEILHSGLQGEQDWAVCADFLSAHGMEDLVQEGFDLAFTKGVLIHIPPDQLRNAYEKLYALSRRYILVAEYFNPTPISIEYRGHHARLWKRDFGADLMEMFPDLDLLGYGFVWRHDPHAPQDDLNWWLFEKHQ